MLLAGVLEGVGHVLDGVGLPEVDHQAEGGCGADGGVEEVLVEGFCMGVGEV